MAKKLKIFKSNVWLLFSAPADDGQFALIFWAPAVLSPLFTQKISANRPSSARLVNSYISLLISPRLKWAICSAFLRASAIVCTVLTKMRNKPPIPGYPGAPCVL
jgi:hypothetical protein